MTSSLLKPGAARLLGLLVLVGLAAAAWLFIVVDSESHGPTDHSPVVAASALDTWQTKWPEKPVPLVSPEGTENSAATEDPAATESPASPDAAEDSTAESCQTMPGKWMVIGWDGADWDLILPLLEAGRLPHLESLMRGGSYGTLHSIVPTLSPAIWTSVATGVAPDQHGILHFYNQKPLGERLLERVKNFGELKRQLYSNADRLSPAIWNELSNRDREVMLVGYHNTFPVEKVNGLMVSNYLMQDSVADVMQMDVDSEGGESAASLGGSLVYPPENLQEVLDIQRRVKRQTPEIARRFAHLEDDEVTPFLRLSQRLDVEDQKPYYLVHAWLFDTIAAEIAEAFLARRQPDLTMVHFQAVDWASHRFYYFHDPELFESMEWSEAERQALEAQIPRYRDTVEAFYIYLDEWLGRLLKLRSPDTAVMVLSDHGFEPDHDPQIPGGHDDAPPGMIVLEGPGIKQNHKLSATNIYDILPTLMSGLGLPVAEDLPGSPIQQAFCQEAWDGSEHPRVASYKTDRPFTPEIMRTDNIDQEILQQLESLGYLD